MDVYLAMMRASLRAQASYRRSFLLEVFGRGWIALLELAAVIALMTQATELAGFGRDEVIYLYGAVTAALGIAELLTDGLNDMPELVRLGTFDGVLVRPAPALIQVMARQCRPYHLGRVAQGALAMGFGLWATGFAPSPDRLAMVVLQLVSATAVFAGIFVAEAGTCVFAVASGELFNAFSFGGQELAKFPMPIYGRWLRLVFLGLVPVGFVSYFPSLVVLDHPDPMGWPAWTPWATPLVAGLFLALTLRWWSFAVDRYRSTGS
ncbi:MAG: ABC-2 family transporter protein [Myxococcales bacterium]|nr:ABC-2 family transporter protein [Myxococcales bacterium]